MPEYSPPSGVRMLGSSDADVNASLLAQIVLAAHPRASHVLLDTYFDDDTFDCGPVIDAGGSIIIGDVSDVGLGITVESIVSGWRVSALRSGNHNWFQYTPETGESRVSLELALAAGQAWGAHDLEAA